MQNFFGEDQFVMKHIVPVPANYNVCKKYIDK